MGATHDKGYPRVNIDVSMRRKVPVQNEKRKSCRMPSMRVQELREYSLDDHYIVCRL